jgi:ATP-dependent Clp protease ATP-binding subunit ClpA
VSNGILRPEFINRFDATILYKALDRESIKKVTKLMMQDLNKHLEKKQNIVVDLNDELISALARKGHDLKFGVRPLARLIQDTVETQIADFLLRSEKPPYNICIIIDADSIDN